MEKGNEKTVSIIVPVYNGEKYLKRCLESLLCQTWEKTEILLVDDGSADGSGQICDDFSEKYEKIRAVHTKNQGVSAARNLGMKICKGEYVSFVDADDCLAKNMIEHLVHLIEETESDVAGCSFWIFGQKEEGGRDCKRKDEEAAVCLKQTCLKQTETCIKQSETCLKQAEILNGQEFMEKGILQSDTRCWSKLYRRESIGSIRFQEGLTIGEDMLFLLELAKEGRQFGCSKYKGYGYFINEEGAMMHGFRDSYMDQITCWERALEILGGEASGLKSKAEAVLLVSAMLVAGKLAVLSGKERREKKKYVERCSRIVREYGRHRETFRKLDRGYKIKVTMYRYMPGIYLGLYHWKNVR